MAGRHGPPSATSFWISLVTAVLRAGLVVAAVVLGVFVLSRAFPSADEPPASVPETPTGESPTTTQSPEGGATSPAPPETSDPSEVQVQVLNSTDVTGLAAEVADMLEAEGYDIRRVDDALSNPEKTTLQFRPQSKVDAQALRDMFFPEAVLEKADPEVVVDVTVILAEDYAESQGGATPEESPS